MSRNLFVAIVFITFGLAALIVTIGLRAYPGGKVPFDYGIVLDAGSSHTSVYLYKWLADQVNNTGLVSEVKSCTTKYGIDDNEENTIETLNDLLPCVRNITTLFNSSENDVTPIYLGATAGMRLLNITKPQTVKIILLEIENSLLRLREKSKLFDIKDIRILNGREEALLAWITVNYLLKVFPKLTTQSSSSSTESNNNKDSYGVLDMGGASAQIGYELQTNEAKYFRNVSKVRLYGNDYFVRSSSNLCYGADEVLARHRFLQVQNSLNTNVRKFTDPCYLKDSEVTVNGNKIFTVCTQTLPNVPVKVLNNHYTERFTFTGQYNEEQCNRLIEKLLDKNECEKTFKYCFQEEKTSPPMNMTFYALASYFYATRAIVDDNKKTHNFEYDQYLTDANLFCSKDFSYIENTLRLKKVAKYAINYCFQLKYIINSLEKIYKFQKHQFENINFVRKVSQETLGWSLGFMINATNVIPPEIPNETILPTYLLVILIIASLIIICFGLWCVSLWKSKRDRKIRTGKEARALELNEKI